MTTLRELAWESHKRAETTQLSKALAKNTITAMQYCNLVYTQYLIFKTIENRLQFDTPCMARSQQALNDWCSMKTSLPPVMQSVDRYIEHLQMCDLKKLWAHIYVNYMGMLYGGQIIKKQIGDRFPTTVFDFDDKDSCIAEIRKNTSPELADEVNLAFTYTIEYYDELYRHN